MLAFISNLEERLRAYGVHPDFFNEFRALVENGVRPCKELRTRLRYVKNYKACLDGILAELSKPVIKQHFPPEVIEVTA